MARQRRRIRGDRAFKKLIKRLPDAAREEMVAMLEAGGDEILAMQQADATVSRRVRAALRKRVLRGALQLKVGLVGRPINRKLWWSRVIEKGRKASVEQVTRRNRSGTVSKYALRVAPLAAKPAIRSERVMRARDTLGGRTRTFWERTLAKASQGLTDD